MNWSSRICSILRCSCTTPGKSVTSDSHVIASVEIANTCLDRLELDAPDRDTVIFLINRHMELSAALRRDIFDPGTIHQFAEKVETPERLKMLCLLTYADIKAVNPDALTPWKAENIWQLYIGTANHMLRTADERLHVDGDHEVLHHLETVSPAAGKKLEGFLEGLPRRYLRTQTAAEILSHMEMASRVDTDPVQLTLTRGRHWYDLTVVTLDRPFLFFKDCGNLGCVGYEHCEGRGVFQSRRHCRGYFLFYGSFSHPRVESARVGAL